MPSDSKPRDAIETGGTLGARYELLGRLTSGGMAEVYLARATGIEEFEKVVVLKRILPHLVEDAAHTRMFRDEARVAAMLEHPNIVGVHDIGLDGDQLFFTMEYLHGENVQTILRAVEASGQRLPLQYAIAIAIACAAALHHAHEQRDYDGRPLSIVHRDVSPGNVIVTRQGAVKLIDFGIAKASSAKHVTAVGTIKGKLSYMSPEQCRGERLDRRADIYSLGVMLFEMTTMQRLVPPDDELAMVRRIQTEDPPLLSTLVDDCPDALDAIVRRALAKNPAQRYRTAIELQWDLERFAFAHGLQTWPGALGYFLEQLLGPKPLPWQKWTSGPTMPERSPSDGLILGSTQESAVVDEVATQRRRPSGTEPAQVVAAAQLATPATASAEIDPTWEPRPRVWPIVAALGAIFGVALMFVSSGGNEPTSTAAGARSEPRPTPSARVEPTPPPKPAAAPRAVPRDPAPPLPPRLPPSEDEGQIFGVPPDPPTPEPEPARSARPRRKPAGPSKKDRAHKLLQDARAAVFTDPRRAYELAQQSYRLRQTTDALFILGQASCRARVSSNAQWAFDLAKGPHRETIAKICRGQGIVLSGS